MIVIKVTLFAILIAVHTIHCKARDDSDAQLANIENEAVVLSNFQGPLDGDAGSILEEEDLHERVKRSPWGGRRRRRWGGVRVRRVRKVISKVGHAIKKVPKVVKKTIKKIPRELGRVAKQGGRLVKKTAKKASTLLRKTVKEIKRAGRRVKTIPRKTGKTIRKIKDKVKESIAKILKKKEEEEEEEEKEVVIVDPEPTSPPAIQTPDLASTAPPVITPKPCDASCQTIRELLKGMEFFKQSHCAFYYTKRNQRDFFLDRNKNTTLDLWMGDIAQEAAGLYSAYVEHLKSVKSDLTIKNEQQLKQDCIQSATKQCRQRTEQDVLALFNMKCFNPCAGIIGCVAEDKRLKNVIDEALRIYAKKLHSESEPEPLSSSATLSR